MKDASIAKTGTWELKDEGWVCLNSNGVEYKNEFCLSQGKEHYVNDEGIMVTSSWINHNDASYYVDEDGAMVVNDWRWLTPADDEDAEEEKYYFDSAGKMVTGKKVIGNETYYFDTDGKMLTGWVEFDGTNYEAERSVLTARSTFYFCDETDGDAKKNRWVKTWQPSAYEAADNDNTQNWYCIGKDALLVKAVDNKYQIVALNGTEYIINTSGFIQTSAKEYKADGVVAVNTKSTEATDTTAANTITFYTNTADGILKGAVKTGAVADSTLTVN